MEKTISYVPNGHCAYEVAISPEDVKEIFSVNEKSGFTNRKLSRLAVSYYKHLMLTGKWRLSNDAICITKEGELINGQTRLTAVKESGTTQHFLMMFDADRSMFPVIDTGRKRSAADFLYSVGGVKKYTKHISSAISWMLSMLYTQVIPFSTHDRVEYTRDYELAQSCYEKHAALLENASAYYSNYPAPKLIVSTACIPCHVLFSYVDAAKAKQFFEALNTKDWGESSVLRLLYCALLRLPSNLVAYYRGNIQTQMLITAWNAFYMGYERKKFSYVKPEEGHVTLPTIAGFDRMAFLDGIATKDAI